MYVIEGKPRTIIGVDGKSRQEVAPTMKFRSAVGMLRWAVSSGEIARTSLQNNGDRSTHIKDVYLGNPAHSASGRLYWTFDTFHEYAWTIEHWDAMYAAQERVRALWHYVSEVLPEWREVETINYADNSTVRIEVNRYGTQRSITLVSPGGDVCY